MPTPNSISSSPRLKVGFPAGAVQEVVMLRCSKSYEAMLRRKRSWKAKTRRLLAEAAGLLVGR
jgi:hypothetical protein